jgi:hypothetical protein
MSKGSIVGKQGVVLLRSGTGLDVGSFGRIWQHFPGDVSEARMARAQAEWLRRLAVVG